MRTGGTASATSAIVMLARERPMNARLIAISARLGRARSTLETLIATNDPVWRWPSTTPTGSAIASAITRPIAEITMCSSVLSTSRPALSVKKLMRSLMWRDSGSGSTA